MIEYKNVTAIKAEIQKKCDNCWHPYRLGGCPEHCGINDAVKAIDSAPTVDAVPVVRCKDCQYWKSDKGVELSKRVKFCTYHIGHQYARHDEDFCSRGERKDGDSHDGS